MSYQPVSGIVPQYSNDSNELASGFYLKFYVANTTTPLSMATDSSGGTLLVKAKLNPDGLPISNPLDNDTVFVPHVNQSYRLVIYRNEDDANADNTAAAFLNVPSLEPLAPGSVSGGVIPYVFDSRDDEALGGQASNLLEAKLATGDYAQTAGKLTPGDGEGQLYEIVDSGGSVTLDNGKQAKIVSKHLTSTGTQTVGAALDDRVVRVGSVAGLRALDVSTLTEGAGAAITFTARTGSFVWRTGDYSTQVAGDEVTAGEGDGGIYIAPVSDKTGTSGAWVRWSCMPFAAYRIQSEWYGAPKDDVDASVLVQHMFNAAATHKLSRSFYFSSGQWRLNNVNLSSSASLGREWDILCAEDAEFRADDNLTSIFDISGQRRVTFTGGKFKRGLHCFYATSGIPVAYGHFNKIRFDGEAASAIATCFYGDSYIGNRWWQCEFGTDQAIDQIDTCIDFIGTSANQTNVNWFTECIFIQFKNYGLRIRDSAFLKAGINFHNCWFEDSDGVAVYAGQNVRNIQFTGSCYFESVGTTGVIPIQLSQALKVTISDAHFINPNTGIPAWIDCDASNLVAKRNFVNLNGFEFVAFKNVTELQRVIDTTIVATGTPTYKDALFSIDDSTTEHFIEWNIPRDSSTTMNDAKIEHHFAHSREFSDGHARWLCDDVSLATDTDWYKVAELVFPAASSGCRVTIELEQLHQGLGIDCIYRESFVTKDGGGNPTEVNIRNDVGGSSQFEARVIATSATLANIEVRRTVGGSSTTVAPVVELKQGDWNLETNKVSIRS